MVLTRLWTACTVLETGPKPGFVEIISEVLARATSVRDSLDQLKAGTVLWKLRDKGSILGLKLYRRKYRLNIADLMISYTPNKGMQNSCVGGPNGNLQQTYANTS